MLRALDEHGGIAVYTRNILEELLRLDESSRYTLLYSSPENVGRYADRPNVTERFLPAFNALAWDQAAVPRALARSGADVVFHPKFTVPLATSVPSVMVLHGADWFFPEQAQYYNRLNAWYMRRVLPLFCRRAARILSVSKLTTENIHRAVRLPEGKVRTVYFAPGRHFQRVDDREDLDRVRQRYDLPERFILTLSKPLGDLRKNLAGVLEGYRRFHGRTDHKLVVGGKDCEAYRAAYGVPGTGWGADVIFPGWIDQRDLPAVYSLADLYLYPSNLEAFPIPITEAMACGTPIVTSDANGLREIAGDAAVRVDPDDPQAICEAVCEVITDRRLHDD
ncbi:MAG: glycosyltransferase family 1 protein, partial [Longimicrobiales bacterium]